MRTVRLFPIAAALAITVAWLAAGTADAGSARASGKVFFYTDVANLVPGTAFKAVPSVRPHVVFMHQDGSWVIEKLHWSSWGGPVARATGISSASNCVPDCAGGKRTNDKVDFVLSQRRHLFGRTVYACFQLTDPTSPPSDGRFCLKHAFGHQYGYAPVAGSPVHVSGFLSPSRNIWCVLSDIPGLREADCSYATFASGHTGPEYAATLHANGHLVTCAWQPSQPGLQACVQNWDTSAPVLKRGQVDVIYQYRCQATSTTITCTVDTGAGKGKGFTISAAGVTPIP